MAWQLLHWQLVRVIRRLMCVDRLLHRCYRSCLTRLEGIKALNFAAAGLA